MKKTLTTLLACSCLLCLAACNTTGQSDTTTSSEVITDVTEGITDAIEFKETTSETTEKFVEGMIKSSLDEITDRFMMAIGDTHDGQEYLRL